MSTRGERWAAFVNAGLSDVDAALKAGYSASYAKTRSHLIRAQAEAKGLLHTKAAAEYVRDIMEDELVGDEKALRDMFQVMLSRARAGDIGAAKEILDRLLGKPAQAIDHTTKGEKIKYPDVVLVPAEGDDA